MMQHVRNQHSALVCAALILTIISGGPLGLADSPGQPPASPSPAATKQDLKQCVTIVGANDANDALSAAAPAGAPLSLVFLVEEALAGHSVGELETMPFASQGEQPPSIATATLRTTGNQAPGEPVSVPLDKQAKIPLSLEFDRLLPGKIYKGQIFLTSGDLACHWDVTVTTGGRGVLAAEPVGTLEFITWSWPWQSAKTGSFDFTLFDKSQGGPYNNVRVRFEPSAGASSKAITSNFNLDEFSFWEKEKPIDLAQAREDRPAASGNGVTVTGSRTFTAQISQLLPGEYSGALHFSADGAADDVADGKLALVIQVRHPWLYPVLVILFGSVIGWFSSKYVVGVRKAADLSQQVEALRQRADYLARIMPPRGGWEFPSEARSLGFARILVDLHRATKLTKSPFQVLVLGDKINLLNQAIELRLKAFEKLRGIRLRVQPLGDDRPSAQQGIGCLLRQATNLLDGPAYGASEQAETDNVLAQIELWAKADSFVPTYKLALLDRLRDCPKIDKAAAELDPVGKQLQALSAALPDETAINNLTATINDLKKFDDKISRMALLWRDHSLPWAAQLAAAYDAGQSLDGLFGAVDQLVWDLLNEHGDTLKLEMDSADQNNPQTYKVIGFNLVCTFGGLEADRLRYHPLKVEWSICRPDGAARTVTSNGLTLIQYFPSKGSATIRAKLVWRGKPIPVNEPLKFAVDDNPDYRSGIFTDMWPELATLGVATIIAIATALGTQYDSTFGSLAQYIGLFIWAAGAGTGGNLFSQLGTSSAPGGAAATLK